ncbi:aminotransferase class V-fold PLP-dependent enzyme [Streptomyces virginiae]|uniref:aminotransferase class V-fold PLP-dependent enzyme n=1 Tax=Streptomyces virginiae TaxID=1961 RepID=UPI00200FCCBE|nr:aminotransferase class V-fold PLP-dependent enzyme [Streptomyces virginiae]
MHEKFREEFCVDQGLDRLRLLGSDIVAPLAAGGSINYVSFDHAASAPVLQQVWDDVNAFIPYYASVNRGTGYLAEISTDLFARSRDVVAEFLDLREDDQVIFTRSTTDSMSLLASSLPPGTCVYVFESEHHASLLPWERTAGEVVYMPVPRSHEEAVTTLRAELMQKSTKSSLVCVTGASNVTGEIWPIVELARTAHLYGARIVVDAAQLAPHYPISVQNWGVDWVAFSGHKIYAPFGAGVLAGRSDWLDSSKPYLAGGGASRSVIRRQDGSMAVEWHTGPARHEAGTPNLIGVLAIASACRALTVAGRDALYERERRQVQYVLSKLAKLPDVRILRLFDEGHPRVAVVSFVVRGWESSDFARRLSAEYGIGVRVGLFCAHPLVRSLLGEEEGSINEYCAGESTDSKGRFSPIRMSFGVDTPQEHLDRFIRAVCELIEQMPSGCSLE